jgi:hypothetical protein
MRDLGQVLAHVHDAGIEIIEGDGPSRGEHSHATVDQLLRKAPAVLEVSGTPDGFNNLGGAVSWMKSLSASVSNGLRSILKFEGAIFAASL